MKRIIIAKILATVASILGIAGIYYMFSCTSGAAVPEGIMTAGLILSPLLAIVAYCLCGFFKALGTPFSLAKWGFLVSPFPVNLLVVIALFLVGLVSIAYIPMIPVFRRAAELGC